MPLAQCETNTLRQQAEILDLKAEIKALKEENAKLPECVAQMETRLRQNSNNEAERLLWKLKLTG